MASLTYRTAGESHGKALIALVEGMPAGVPVDQAFIDGELRRRQGGYGRGGRQKIETDHAEFLTGVRLGNTIASPMTMLIPNKDSRLDDPAATPPLHRPRPGHADLAGSVKWLTTDCRETLERASARETAARVAAGALARCLLRGFGIEVFGFVRAVGLGGGANRSSPTRELARNCSPSARRIGCLLPRRNRRARRCGISSTSRKMPRTPPAESSRRMSSAARSASDRA